jgi:hypothetical protein
LNASDCTNAASTTKQSATDIVSVDGTAWHQRRRLGWLLQLYLRLRVCNCTCGRPPTAQGPKIPRFDNRFRGFSIPCVGKGSSVDPCSSRPVRSQFSLCLNGLHHVADFERSIAARTRGYRIFRVVDETQSSGQSVSKGSQEGLEKVAGAC